MIIKNRPSALPSMSPALAYGGIARAAAAVHNHIAPATAGLGIPVARLANTDGLSPKTTDTG